MIKKHSGILVHISSLPSSYGIGDLGPSAYDFVDFLNSAGQKYWQILPLNPISASTGNSPYCSNSAFALNTLYISPELLCSDGYVEREDIKSVLRFKDNVADFKNAVKYKNQLLEKVYLRSFDKIKKKNSFKKFIEDERGWLYDYALYLIIKHVQNEKPWNLWPDHLLDASRQTLDIMVNENKTLFEKIQLNQFLVFEQYRRLKSYCSQKGVQIIGDMPIYVSYDSADVWRNQKIFKLDEAREPVFVSGVPPDYFSDDGQLWGNPVYDWDYLKEIRYAWWVERFRKNLEIYDCLRVDHFRGLVQFWQVQRGEKTAKNGHWEDVPTEDFLNTLKKEFSNGFPIFAEDLGVITDDVRDIMIKHDLPGMKILLFAFNGDLITHPYLPHNYTGNCIVYTGTHDNNTANGWYTQEATGQEKLNINEYIGKKVSAGNIHKALICLAFDSKANTAIIPLQDYLGLGQSHRMNKPGVAFGNWKWRFKKEVLSRELLNFIQQITKKSKR